MAPSARRSGSFDPGLRLGGNVEHVDGSNRRGEPFAEADGSGSICLAQSGDESGLHGNDLREEGVDERLAIVG